MAASLAELLENVGAACKTLALLDAGTLVRAVASGRIDELSNNDPSIIISFACHVLEEHGSPPPPPSSAGSDKYSTRRWHLHWALCGITASALEISHGVPAPSPCVSQAINVIYLPFLEEVPEDAVTAHQREQLLWNAESSVIKSAAWDVALDLIRRSTHSRERSAGPWVIQLSARLIHAAVADVSPAKISISGPIMGTAHAPASPQEDVLRCVCEESFLATLDRVASTVQDTPHSRALGQFLLPAELVAANAMGTDRLAACLSSLWNTCN